MKKYILLAFSLLLISCSSKDTETVQDPIETISPQVTTNEASINDAASETIARAVSTLTNEIGEFTLLDKTNDSDTGMQLTFNMQLENRNLKILYYEYIDDCYIADAESGHIYYAPNTFASAMHDIYDFETDELIQSASTKTPSELLGEYLN